MTDFWKSAAPHCLCSPAPQHSLEGETTCCVITTMKWKKPQPNTVMTLSFRILNKIVLTEFLMMIHLQMVFFTTPDSEPRDRLGCVYFVNHCCPCTYTWSVLNKYLLCKGAMKRRGEGERAGGREGEKEERRAGRRQEGEGREGERKEGIPVFSLARDLISAHDMTAIHYCSRHAGVAEGPS